MTKRSEARRDRRIERRGGTPPTRYQMREKLISIGQDSYIEDANGNKVFHVDGKVMRVRDTLFFKGMQGNKLAKIQERKLRIKDTMEIEGPDGERLALDFPAQPPRPCATPWIRSDSTTPTSLPAPGASARPPLRGSSPSP